MRVSLSIVPNVLCGVPADTRRGASRGQLQIPPHGKCAWHPGTTNSSSRSTHWQTSRGEEPLDTPSSEYAQYRLCLRLDDPDTWTIPPFSMELHMVNLLRRHCRGSFAAIKGRGIPQTWVTQGVCPGPAFQDGYGVEWWKDDGWLAWKAPGTLSQEGLPSEGR